MTVKSRPCGRFPDAGLDEPAAALPQGFPIPLFAQFRPRSFVGDVACNKTAHPVEYTGEQQC